MSYVNLVSSNKICMIDITIRIKSFRHRRLVDCVKIGVHHHHNHHRTWKFINSLLILLSQKLLIHKLYSVVISIVFIKSEFHLHYKLFTNLLFKIIFRLVQFFWHVCRSLLLNYLYNSFYLDHSILSSLLLYTPGL